MSLSGKSIIIERDITAILVPSGHTIDLKAGTPVRVTQALGDSYSVEVFGQLLMIAGTDCDALGLERDTAQDAFLDDSSLSMEEKAVKILKTCYDPEIPVNIYDLGLIYAISDLNGHLHVTMTLTSPTCGMGPFIVEEAKRKLHRIPNIQDVTMELIFDPPWDRSRMSQAAKLELNLM